VKFKDWVHNVADVTQLDQPNIKTQLAIAEAEHTNGELNALDIGHGLSHCIARLKST
jgi:hypothetical protein